MDRVNFRHLEYRIQKAQVIIFLDMPRYLCMWRAANRSFKYWGKEIPTNAAGCRQRIDFDFLKFLRWIWNFKKSYRLRVLELLEQYKDTKTIYIFKDAREVQNFLKSINKI